MRKIIVEDYNIEWSDEFQMLKSVYLEHMKHLNIEVQHVGSTSVPGLAAKPILDMDIIIDEKGKQEPIIEALAELGYAHQGDLGIKGREAFKRKSDNVPYYKNQSYQFAHNLYVCVASSDALRYHLLFRDYLRKNCQAASEYGTLKKKLAAKYEYDIDSYIEGKTGFITNILSITGVSDSDISEIIMQNKKD